jgi:RHS repeat-associated protein
MSSPQKVLNCRYRYDPLDRLTSHTQSDTPERHRFYCKNRLATEIQGAIGHSIVQQGDLLLAQHQRQNGVLDSTLLATDLQRSVLNTLKSGRQPQPIAYSPYGHRPAESGLSSLLGFNGERPDPVTGHYLLGNGYRAFNPVLMRFNSPDSLSPFGKGGLNTYAYCEGEPINRTDPAGHFFKKITHLIQSIANKINKTKINKDIDNVISKLKADYLEQPYIKETIKKQTEMIFKRHPTGLKTDDPFSLTSMSLKAVPPHELAEISPGIVNRDIAREIFFGELKNGPITDNTAINRLYHHINESAGRTLIDDQLPPMYRYANRTNLDLVQFADRQDRRYLTIPFDKIIFAAEMRKTRRG